MTPDPRPLADLTPAEVNAELHERLTNKRPTLCHNYPKFGQSTYCVWVQKEGGDYSPGNHGDWVTIPDYCADTPDGHYAAHQLGERLRAMGLGEQYGLTLAVMIDRRYMQPGIEQTKGMLLSLLADTPPEQRARAALAVLRASPTATPTGGAK